MTCYFEFWTGLPKILALDWSVKKVSCFLYGFLNFYSFSWQEQKLRLAAQILSCRNCLKMNRLCFAFDGKEHSEFAARTRVATIHEFYLLPFWSVTCLAVG